MAYDFKQEELLSAQRRYIRAKLHKFELDQVTKPFAETKDAQGLKRAVTGVLQRGVLILSGTHDNYVAQKIRQIDNDRAAVASFEQRTGEEVFARQLYHNIRDRPETLTYKDTRRAFRDLKYQLAQDESGLKGDWLIGAKAWARYRKRELVSAAAGLGIATLITVPVHSHNEYKDHNRPVFYKKYQHNPVHPMIRMGIAANNLEMYLNETFNHNDETSFVAGSVAQEWEDFIKPGANKYNLQFTNNDAGNDWTRPWGTLFEDARIRANLHLKDARPIAVTLGNGARAVDGSWNHWSVDTTHIETYDCGTSEKPATCTKTVYDYTDHYWTLNRSALISAAGTIDRYKDLFPQLERANSNPLIDVESTIPYYAKGKSREEALQALNTMNQWSTSLMITAYNQMLGAAASLKASSLPLRVTREAPSYPTSYHNRSYFHVPTSYPNGLSQSESLSASAMAVYSPYEAVDQSLETFSTFIPRIQKNMDIAAGIGNVGKKTNAAMRDLGDLAYEVHNANYAGSSWIATHGTRIFLEWLLFVGLAAGAGFGTYYCLDKTRYDAWNRRMFSADIDPDRKKWSVR